MELRRIRLIQELREAREELLNINFTTDTTNDHNVARPNGRNVSRPYSLVTAWLGKWDPTFKRYGAFSGNAVTLDYYVTRQMQGYQLETDAEIFNEMRPMFVGLIDYALSNLDQQYQVPPVLEDYTQRVADTKLAEMLKEFNATKARS